MAELNQLDMQELGHRGRGFPLYAFRPKMHLLVHCLGDQVRITGNPSEVWCYPDESEIGAAVKVAESLHPKALHRTVIKKHRVL